MKPNMLLSLIIIVLVIQLGFITHQHQSIKVLDDEIVSLDSAINSLAQELGLTKTELQDKIDDSSAQTKKDLNKLTEDVIQTQSDVIQTQEDLEEQSEQLEEQLDNIKGSVSSDFSSVIENTINGVVSIKTDVSQGSGFIISDGGYVVTNYHVINGASAMSIIPYQDSLKAVTIIGYNIGKDVALLKILGNYDYLELGNSDNVNLGDEVIAMGNPYGLPFSVTQGIISALDRSGPSGDEAYIQTDVPLNPGNSGGPLVNKAGKVIGINNFKIGGAESLGFALESNEVIEIVNEISQGALGEDLL